MHDPPRPANLCLSVAVTLVLALSVSLIMITSCGSPTTRTPQIISTSPPDQSPADVMATPTSAAEATTPAREAAAFLGMWSDDSGFVLELGDNGVFTRPRRRRPPITGTWSLQEDGTLDFDELPYVAIPHGNLLLLGGTDAAFLMGILHRVDDDGNLQAYEPVSALEVPPIDPSAILTIAIADHWTGLSPLAPIEADFRLEPATDHFSGMAEFSVAGYTEAISRSVPISVPQAVIEELLALLESTPLEAGEYKRVFSHTDDFPRVVIAVKGRAGDLEFASESQGSRHIPWSVLVGADQYVTYADTPAQALDLLDPYLAREVQEELYNLALERDS
jgi:hypothetical protein